MLNFKKFKNEEMIYLISVKVSTDQDSPSVTLSKVTCNETVHLMRKKTEVY
jgi:hypothetical protein